MGEIYHLHLKGYTTILISDVFWYLDIKTAKLFSVCPKYTVDVADRWMAGCNMTSTPE